MARRDIAFDAEGVTLRGWFYEGASGPAPTIVMAHGFSAVKEMYLDKYAETFAAAGLNALVFDNRNFGASDGEPRQEIDPWAQVRDYRHAITYATTLPEVDRDRIGVWGSSYSGGHVLVVAAIDRRVKAVVAQVPLVSGHDNFRALVRADFLDKGQEFRPRIPFDVEFNTTRLLREGRRNLVHVVRRDMPPVGARVHRDARSTRSNTHIHRVEHARRSPAARVPERWLVRRARCRPRSRGTTRQLVQESAPTLQGRSTVY